MQQVQTGVEVEPKVKEGENYINQCTMNICLFLKGYMKTTAGMILLVSL